MGLVLSDRSRVVEEMIEAYNARDVDRMLSYFAEDAVTVNAEAALSTLANLHSARSSRASSPTTRRCMPVCPPRLRSVTGCASTRLLTTGLTETAAAAGWSGWSSITWSTARSRGCSCSASARRGAQDHAV